MTGRPREATRKVVEYTAAGNPVQHGLKQSYSVHGCRCLACTEAKQAADAAYWEKYPYSRRRHPPTYAPPLLGFVMVNRQLGKIIGHDLRNNQALVAWKAGGRSYVPWADLREKKL